MTTNPTKRSALSENLKQIAEGTGKSDTIHVPDVVGHYMLIGLPEKTEKIGSVYLPDEVAEGERMATVVGTVLKQGPDCYRGTYPNGIERFPTGPWCQVGDFVVFSRYTGHRIRIGGVEFRVMADDQILAVADDDARKEVTGL